MVGREQEDHIKLFLDSLAAQTFTDFEAIIADCIYDRREEHVENNSYKGRKYPFKIYHVPVRSPWLRRGCWAGQAPWNHTLLVANGELFLTFGDCCELPPHYLEHVWSWYEKGYWCMGLVIYKKADRLYYIGEEDLIEPAPHSSIETWSQGIRRNLKELQKRGVIKDLVRDSRWPLVENASGVAKLKGRGGAQQFHGYSAVPLRALLKINGFDENFDGDKALGDVDTGLRLRMAGYDNMLVLDREVWLYENAHYGIPEDVLWYKGPTVRSNYSLLTLNEMKNRWRANSYRLTPEEVDWICEHAKNWGFRNVDQKANPLFQAWLKNPPIFDLEELRWQVQNNLNEDSSYVEMPEYYVWDDEHEDLRR
jgi:hypothetical protein